MARRRSARRRHMLYAHYSIPTKTGLGALTDSKFFIPGLIGVGALAFLMLRKKKPTESEKAAEEAQKIMGAAQRATKDAADTVAAAAQSVALAEEGVRAPVQQKDQMVSMGSDKPKTLTELVAQVRGNETASGPAGTEMQGGGSVSADPIQQLKLMSTPDFLAMIVKNPAFKAAVMANVPLGGDLGAEMERRFGADGRRMMVEKMHPSAFLLSNVIGSLQRMYAKGAEDDYIADVLFFNKNKDMKGKFVEGRKVEDDAFYTLAYYNVVMQELADRASGKKPEPAASAIQPAVPAEPVKVLDKSSGMLVDVKPAGPIQCIMPPCRPPASAPPAASVPAGSGFLPVPTGTVKPGGLGPLVLRPTGTLPPGMTPPGQQNKPPDQPMLVTIPLAQAQTQFPNHVLTGFVGLRGGMPYCRTGTKMTGVVERACPTREQVFQSGGSGSKPPASAFPMFNISLPKPAGQMTPAPSGGTMQPAVMRDSLPPVTGGSAFWSAGPTVMKPFGR